MDSIVKVQVWGKNLPEAIRKNTWEFLLATLPALPPEVLFVIPLFLVTFRILDLMLLLLMAEVLVLATLVRSPNTALGTGLVAMVELVREGV